MYPESPCSLHIPLSEKPTGALMETPTITMEPKTCSIQTWPTVSTGVYFLKSDIILYSSFSNFFFSICSILLSRWAVACSWCGPSHVLLELTTRRNCAQSVRYSQPSESSQWKQLPRATDTVNISLPLLNTCKPF